MLRGGDGVPVTAEERAPLGSLTSLGCGEHTFGGEDALEVERLTERPRFVRAPRMRVVPQRGFSRATRSTRSRISWAIGGRPGPRLLVPSYLSATRCRYHRRIVSGVTIEASFWISFAAESPALLGEPPALGVGEAQPSPAEVLSEHAVFLEQILDGFCLAAVHPARDGEQEEVEGTRLHDRGLAWASARRRSASPCRSRLRLCLPLSGPSRPRTERRQVFSASTTEVRPPLI